MCVVIKKRTFPVLDNLAKLADLLIQLKDNEDQANIELFDEILSTTSRLESESQKTELAKFYNQTSRLISNVRSLHQISFSQTSATTQVLKSATNLFRIVNESGTRPRRVDVSSLKYHLQEQLCFYWRWVHEEPLKLDFRSRTNLDLDGQLVFWIYLNVTSQDQPVLVAKQSCQSVDNLSLAKIFGAIIQRADKNWTEIQIGRFLLRQNVWSEVREEKFKLFRRVKNSVKTKTDFKLYTVYLKQ